MSYAPPERPRTVCNWSELRELTEAGVHIGAHSVTHVPIAEMTPIRQQFEVNVSKTLIAERIGECSTFAYPFGTRGSYSAVTSEIIKSAGYDAAFLTHTDFVTANSHPLELARITLPDLPLPLYEFKARVRGGGLPLRLLKDALRLQAPSDQ